MSHDNVRFNVSGESEEGLAYALKLWALINRGSKYKRDNSEIDIDFVGYSIHKNFGMLLHWYDTKNNPDMIKFPFDEGKSAKKLASLFYHYLDSAKIEPLPEKPEVLHDFTWAKPDERWDGDLDHDGDNDRGWRLFTGPWGHIDNHSISLAIKPIYCWYGK